MRRCAPVLLLLAAGCYDFAGLSGRFGEVDSGVPEGDLASASVVDSSTGVDLVAADAEGPHDLTMSPDAPIDLARPRADLAGRDLASPPPDLTEASPDLAAALSDLAAAPPDLAATPPDLAAPTDFARAADLARAPDLVVVPNCNDGVRNGGETDVDCGGRNCVRCVAGRRCLLGIDCASLACESNTCGSGIGLAPAFLAPAATDAAKAYTKLVMADFNSDGRSDVGAAGGGTFSIFLGNGDGTFLKPRVTNVAPPCADVAARDLNADGAADVALACGTIIDGVMAVFYGRNDGTFNVGPVYPSGSDPEAIAIGDLDGNASPDVVLLRAGLDNIRAFNNRGNGTFTTQAGMMRTGWSPAEIVVADLNGDARGDIALASYTNGPGMSGSVSVRLGTGVAFNAVADYGVPFGANSIAAADLSGDGFVDLTTANSTNGQIAVLLGKGDGTLLASRSYAAQATTSAVAVDDFDRDGRLDVAALNRGGNSVSIFLGTGDGTLGAPLHVPLGVQLNAWGMDLVAGDLNGDRKPDLVLTHPAGNAVLVLLNNAR